MKLLSGLFLALSTITNFFLAERLHAGFNRYLCLILLVLSAAQGLSFVGFVYGANGLPMSKATTVYDVVVIVCWYGLLLIRGESVSFAGRVGVLMVGIGVMLVFK